MENQFSEQQSQETIIVRFGREKKEWSQKISELTKQLVTVESMILLEVDIFSQRQILLEYIHKLMGVSSKVNNEYKKRLKERIIYYTEGFNIRLDKAQKTLFSEVDLESILAKKTLINNHLEYMRGTLDTIDKLIYGIKWRIQLEEFKNIRS